MLVSTLALPLLATALLLGFGRLLPQRATSWITPLPALGSFILLLLLMPTVLQHGFVRLELPWIPNLEVDFTLHLHGLGLLMALLVSGIGTLIVLYASGYMEGKQQAYRLYAYLYLFMFAMLGMTMADHLVLFFVFWELTSISSYLLIGYLHEKEESRRNALQALTVTGLGGMALLAGFILLAVAGGSWQLSELPAMQATILEHPLYPGILTLVLLGAFTKSAQFPFYFWLPNAMAAPTPVSAYLHSATMVKAGIYLLAIMLPILGSTVAWQISLTVAGGFTLLLGGLIGLKQTDLKKILAATTLAVLGALTLLLGLGSAKAVLAALLFLLGHAFYKAALFMVAGSVDHGTGTRDIHQLGKLGKLLPWTAAAAALAAFSKMGLPPFFGFLGKEYSYKASLAQNWDWLVTLVLIVGNAMLIALAYRAAIHPFWSKKEPQTPHEPHEVGWAMRIGPVILAAGGVIIGMFPHLVEPLLSAAKSVSVGAPVEAEIKLWHGFNLPLLLSGITLLSGIALIVLPHKATARLLLPLPSGDQVYHQIFQGVLAFGKVCTQTLQNGYLRRYIQIMLVTTFLLILYQLFRFGGLQLISPTLNIRIPELVLLVLMLLATYFAIVTRSRLTALISLGGVGFGVALIFALYSAPDLAITQVLVETLTVVLFAWVVYRLPAYRPFSSSRTRTWDAVVCSLIGIVVTLMVLKSTEISFGASISEQLTAWSLPEARGANVVNVILVDFRALDTWGEITVLAIAAIGVWALTAAEPGHQPVSFPLANPLLAQAARYLAPLLLVLSLVVLYRGHNLPGGGFIGGLIAASAILLMALAHGWPQMEERWPMHPTPWMVAGLALALGSGLWALFLNEAFMTGQWLPTFSLPLLGKVKLGTPLLFDIGVYITVIAFTLKSARSLGTSS